MGPDGNRHDGGMAPGPGRCAGCGQSIRWAALRCWSCREGAFIRLRDTEAALGAFLDLTDPIAVESFLAELEV